MSIFDRMSRGWQITINSMKVLRANKQLLVFPVLSGITLLLLAASFIIPVVVSKGNLADRLLADGGAMPYLITFVAYVVGYFVVVFFNMALIHCTRLYFNGEEATVGKGLAFSMSRLGTIFKWAVFAGTVGTLLKILQDNLGWIGKILIGIVGFAWSVGTFFVVPILAYEEAQPTDALKRSVEMMKKQWGERVGAAFSFGLLNLILIVIFGITGAAVSALISEGLGIAIFVMALPVIFVVNSALHTIFISAVYHNITGDIETHFNKQMLDGLFEERRR